MHDLYYINKKPTCSGQPTRMSLQSNVFESPNQLVEDARVQCTELYAALSSAECGCKSLCTTDDMDGLEHYEHAYIFRCPHEVQFPLSLNEKLKAAHDGDCSEDESALGVVLESLGKLPHQNVVTDNF
jgi:hypothetical protein